MKITIKQTLNQIGRGLEKLMKWKVYKSTIGNPDGTEREGGTFILDADSGRDIAYLPIQPNKELHAEMIAATPELLDSLEIAIEYLIDNRCEWAKNARAIIAKAKGRQESK